MIYTVTFNPALDYVVKMDSLELGMVNRSKSEAIFYGGKGINVSTVLKNIGVDSVALGFVAGFTGKEIEDGVKAMGVKTDFYPAEEWSQQDKCQDQGRTGDGDQRTGARH